MAILLFAGVASAQLNPTVKVMATPTGPIPESCTAGQAPQEQARIDVSQIPPPATRVSNVAPPSSSLRTLLHDVLNAADRGDRAGFRDALARVKGVLATYPTGGERTAALDLVRVFDDLDRVWSYQIDTPTGAFFDASTAPAEVMRGYPGYERAIADQIFIDDAGHRFYPTSETRDYLLREAGQRLNKLGVSVPLRVLRTPREVPSTGRATRQTRTAEKRSTETRTSETRTTEKRTAEKPKHTTTATTEERRTKASTSTATATPKKHRQVTHVAEATSRPSPVRRTEPATASPKQPESSRETTRELNEALKQQKPAVAAPHVATKTTVPEPAPATATHAETTTPAAKPPAVALPMTPPSPAKTESPKPATETTPSATTVSTATSSANTSTDTTASSTVAPTETTASAASTDTTGTEGKPQQPQGKGMILPIILIVVGVGVLIVLFRASS